MLAEILKIKKSELKRTIENVPLKNLRSAARDIESTRNFAAAVRKTNKLSIIAELKRKSPASGEIKLDLDLVSTVKKYESGGAKAISILTDASFFGAEKDDLITAKSNCNLPALRKDFIIDEYQIYQSRVMGADSILLIARILSAKQLQDYIGLCSELSMSALVEIHNENEVEKAIEAKSPIIGVNNRDLDTMTVDLKRAEKLVRYLKKSFITVSESGITRKEELKHLYELGFDAALIGHELLKSPDPEAKLKELSS